MSIGELMTSQSFSRPTTLEGTTTLSNITQSTFHTTGSTSLDITNISTTGVLDVGTFSQTTINYVETGSNTPPGRYVLLYIFVPVIVIFLFGGIVLMVKYTRRRSGVKRLRRQLVPLRQYDVSTDLELDDNLSDAKPVEPCCNDPLLTFKQTDRPNAQIQNTC